MKPIARPSVLLCGVCLAAIVATRARPGMRMQVQDPAEVQAERIAQGQLLFDNACFVCHGGELMRQQSLEPAQWSAELDKMIGWGAFVPPEERANLQEYLVRTAGPLPADRFADSRKPPRMRKPAWSPGDPVAEVVGDAKKGAALYAEHCARCHGDDARGGEPGENLVEQPILLRPAEFRAAVHLGRRRMPAFSEVLDETRETDILAWLRAIRYEPGG